MDPGRVTPSEGSVDDAESAEPWAVELAEGGVRYSLWLPNQETDYIQQLVARTGRPYEHGMLEDMKARLKPGDHVLDVGANIGNHTLYLGAVVGCRVTAIEANPALCEILRRSAAMNGLLDKIRIVEAGAGAKPGRARFERERTENLGAQRLTFTGTDECSVEIVAIDDLEGLDDVRLLKIDVEGMESEVIEGATRLLERVHPLVYVEALDEESFLALDRRLATLGYCFWDTFNKDATHLFIHTSEVQQSDRTLQLHKHLTRTQYYRQTAMEGLLPRLHELVGKLDTAWARFHEVSAEARKQRQQFLARESELEEELAAVQSQLASAEGQVRDLQATQQRQRAELAALKTAQAEQAALLGRDLAEVLHLAPDLGSDAGRGSPLDTLLRPALALPRRFLANRCVALAKSRYGANESFRLALASLASTLDPRPTRQKWFGFRLHEAGLSDRAHQVLSGLAGRVAFSTSEQRVLEEIERRRAPGGTGAAATAAARKRPLSDTSRRPREMNVAVIVDEFSYLSFRDEFNAIVLEPGTWREQLAAHDIDLFFCESAWSGVDSVKRPWQGKIYASERFSKENRRELLAILATCLRQGIPTAFWNKEDPGHFDDRVHDFVKTAQQFDHVFTTAVECVERYRSEFGCRQVSALPFAAQPRIYNPIERQPRSRKATFAGSWYGYFPERCADMRALFQAVTESGLELEIYDRFHGGTDPNHQFPEEYRPFIRPSVSADRVAEVMKSAIFGLNVNSIKDSRTMFARRVFELMASNTLVISNYSLGMEELFGDTVLFADREPGRLAALTEAEVERMRDAALHHVLQEHTYARRFATILDAVGIPYRQEPDALTVVTRIASPEQAQAAIRAAEGMRQELPDSRTLLLVATEVSSVDVPQYYEDFNRLGVGVVSEEYLLKYREGDAPVIDTPAFALVSAEPALEAGALGKARLHRQYHDGGIIQFGSPRKHVFGPPVAGLNLIGPGSQLLRTLRHLREGGMPDVYHL